MSRGTEQTFFEVIYEKELNITNHGNANQTPRMAHLLEWLLSKRQEIISADEDVEKRENSNSIGGSVNWDSHYGNSMEGPLKIKNVITI